MPPPPASFAVAHGGPHARLPSRSSASQAATSPARCLRRRRGMGGPALRESTAAGRGVGQVRVTWLQQARPPEFFPGGGGCCCGTRVAQCWWRCRVRVPTEFRRKPMLLETMPEHGSGSSSAGLPLDSAHSPHHRHHRWTAAGFMTRHARLGVAKTGSRYRSTELHKPAAAVLSCTASPDLWPPPGAAWDRV